LTDAATVVKAGTTTDSDAVAAAAAAGFLAPPQQELAATGATDLALSTALDALGSAEEQQEADTAAEAATDNDAADCSEEAMDAVKAA
jgi:hypothetical protein